MLKRCKYQGGRKVLIATIGLPNEVATYNFHTSKNQENQGKNFCIAQEKDLTECEQKYIFKLFTVFLFIWRYLNFIYFYSFFIFYQPVFIKKFLQF